MPPTNRRPRTVDTSAHFCPHTGCDYRGWLGLGNLRANGHPSGGPWRQFQCLACEGYFLETHGTIFHGKRVAVELIVRVLACLAEGLGIRATARVFEVDPNTVLMADGSGRATQGLSSYFLCDVHVRQVQLDELYAVPPCRQGRRSARRRPAVAPGAFARLGLDGDGPREQAAAGDGRRSPHPGHGPTGGASGGPGALAPAGLPLFLTDGLKSYSTALLTRYFGQWRQPERRRDGPMPKPRWMPQPGLLYAQVVKSIPASACRIQTSGGLRHSGSHRETES